MRQVAPADPRTDASDVTLTLRFFKRPYDDELRGRTGRRFGGGRGALFDHLIRPQQQRLRDREAEGLGGFEIDDQLELCGLFDG